MDENYQQPITPRLLDISWATIVKIIVSLGALYLLFLIRDILIWFIFALVISILFNPAINFLKKLKVPRILGTILVYSGLFILIGGFIYMISSSLIGELSDFGKNFPDYFDQIIPYLGSLKLDALQDYEAFSTAVEEGLLKASGSIFTAIGSIFGGVMSAIAIFAIAFFLSLEEDGLAKLMVLASPREYKTKVLQIWKKTQKKISSWFGIRIICCLFIGVVTSITCSFLDVQYSITFGILAGLANFIVTIGPFFAGLIIFMFIATSAGISQAVGFLIAYFIAQEIENYIIMPVLSKKILRLSPTLVLISLMIGAKLWGILGAILAIPMVGMFAEFIRGFLEKKNE